MRTRVRWAIFISGTGSNLGALLDIRDRLDIACVVSSRKQALGILKARRAGVPVIHFSKDMSWEALTLQLLDFRVDRIFLAGFMKVVPEEFVERWRGKIVNVHPSLLPAYPGLESIARAYQDGAPLGVTVHEVNEIVDGGRILKQGKTWKQKFENLESAEMATHWVEHRLVREVAEAWKNPQMSS